MRRIVQFGRWQCRIGIAQWSVGVWQFSWWYQVAPGLSSCSSGRFPDVSWDVPLQSCQRMHVYLPRTKHVYLRAFVMGDKYWDVYYVSRDGPAELKCHIAPPVTDLCDFSLPVCATPNLYSSLAARGPTLSFCKLCPRWTRTV